MQVWYAADLIPGKLPAGFSKSVTVAGLLNHSEERYPVEWAAIKSSLIAMRRLLGYFNDGHPHDGHEDELVVRAVAELTSVKDCKTSKE